VQHILVFSRLVMCVGWLCCTRCRQHGYRQRGLGVHASNAVGHFRRIVGSSAFRAEQSC